MKPFDDLVDRARKNPKHIVLAEGEDPRIIEGAQQVLTKGVAKLTLLGREDIICSRAHDLGFGELRCAIIDPEHSPVHNNRYSKAFQELRKHKGVTLEMAKKKVREPLFFANMMVHLGEADGSVAGAHYTTGDTVRSAIQTIGMSKDISFVSSFFIMMLCEPFHDIKGPLVLADCALNVDPDSEQLSQIAMASADSAKVLLNMTPRVAMLSFSTMGSAEHAFADKVIRATKKVKRLRPTLDVDGELQLDAAIIPEINAMKVRGSMTYGLANVLVFPDIQAGNIAYKLLERLGKAKAIGPILQGLAKPANDLSRGCKAEDVFRVVAVTTVQAQVAGKK
jgi:phosphate acetyltransferase